MITLPQEANIMRGRSHDKLISDVTKLIALGKTTPLANSNGVVKAIIDSTISIPPMDVPVMVIDSLGRKHFCINLQYTNKKEYKLEDNGMKYSPIILTDTNFMTNLAIAMKIWVENINGFSAVYADSCKIYALWTGLKIAKRMVLNPLQTNELVLRFAYFYITRLYKTTKLTEQEFNFIVNRIQMIFGVYSLEEIRMALSPFELEVHPDLDSFCASLSMVTENPKFKKFNRILMQSGMIGSWMAKDGKLYTMLATEYPPMFMVMLYRAIGERSFKDSDIAQVVYKAFNSAKQKQYSLIFADLLRSSITVNTAY